MHTLPYPMTAAYMQAPSITSTGGAAVASSFNFTRAAEMRAAAMLRQSPASLAPAPVQALQPGTELGTELPGRAAKAGTPPPAQPGVSMAGGVPASVTPAGSTQGAAGGGGPLQAAGGTAGMQPIAAQLCQHARCISKHSTGTCRRRYHPRYICVASQDRRAWESQHPSMCTRTCDGASGDKHRCKNTCYLWNSTSAAAA